jgi:hypothetical protein
LISCQHFRKRKAACQHQKKIEENELKRKKTKKKKKISNGKINVKMLCGDAKKLKRTGCC